VLVNRSFTPGNLPLPEPHCICQEIGESQGRLIRHCAWPLRSKRHLLSPVACFPLNSPTFYSYALCSSPTWTSVPVFLRLWHLPAISSQLSSKRKAVSTWASVLNDKQRIRDVLEPLDSAFQNRHAKASGILLRLETDLAELRQEPRPFDEGLQNSTSTGGNLQYVVTIQEQIEYWLSRLNRHLPESKIAFDLRLKDPLSQPSNRESQLLKSCLKIEQTSPPSSAQSRQHPCPTSCLGAQTVSWSSPSDLPLAGSQFRNENSIQSRL
jgi:hypothetical protein